jgi:hypothetical protein
MKTKILLLLFVLLSLNIIKISAKQINQNEAITIPKHTLPQHHVVQLQLM